MGQYSPPQQPYGTIPVPQEQPRTIRLSLPNIRPWVTYTLIVVTAIAFGLQYLSQTMTGGDDLLFDFGGKINQYILQGQLWRLITPVFLHESLIHIGFNMYALYILGVQVERVYGHWRFLVLYFLGGFAGNVLSFVFSPPPSLGASTAIFGVLAAEAVLVYQNRSIFGKRARGLLYNVLIIGAINLAIGLVPGSLIDNFGHLGGILGGAIFAWLAGPKWEIEGLFPDAKVVDQRQPGAVWTGILVVGLIFGGLTLYHFFF